jgi:Domain of unknown function (DUF4166)/DCC1-like thiol-disulfide oxidoreductase
MTGILLHNVLGAGFDAMPEAVRRMHGIETTQNAVGTARIMGGTNTLSRLFRIMAALPGPARRATVRVCFIKGPDHEEWDRRFGNGRLHTVMKQEGPYLTERLAALPVTFVYQARASHRGFSLHAVQVRFLGLPLPRLLRPTVGARVGEWRGRYRFSVLAGFWFCGRVVSYAGYLDPPSPGPAANPPVTIVYDGLCHLCSGSVAWIARRVDDRVRFVPVHHAKGPAHWTLPG